MAEDSDTSRAFLAMTTASSTSWCRELSLCGIWMVPPFFK